MSGDLPDWQAELVADLVEIGGGDPEELAELVAGLGLPEPDPRELAVGVGSARWTLAKVRARLRTGDYDGVAIHGGSRLDLRDLTFLQEFPALRKVAVEVRLPDDTAAFALTGLRELALVTNCRKPVPDCLLPELRRLVLTERPGMTMAKWPGVEVLRLGRWRSGDVDFLAGGAALRSVELEGSRQQVRLDGLAGCTSLEVLRTVDAAVADLAPLRGLDRLRELRLVSRRAPHGELDLTHLTSPFLETLWIGQGSPLRGIASLARLPALRDLNLVDHRGDPDVERELQALPDHVRVTLT